MIMALTVFSTSDERNLLLTGAGYGRH